MKPRLPAVAVLLIALAACGRQPAEPAAAPPSQAPTQTPTPTQTRTPTQPPSGRHVLDGLLTEPVGSLAPRIRAVVGGGDGATLLPFEAVARSVGGGAWEGFVVPKERGARGYTEGQVVLPDGRLLVLLSDWSSDRGWDKPGQQHHGLWVSDGRNWASYAPYAATFRPALGQDDRLDELVVEGRRLLVTAGADRRYVSTDAGRTWRAART